MNQQNNEQQQFQCTGDCLKCMPVQRQYCASQHAYSSMRILQAITESLESMKGSIAELQEKVSAIQGNEALLFVPSSAEPLPSEQAHEQEQSGPECTEATDAAPTPEEQAS